MTFLAWRDPVLACRASVLSSQSEIRSQFVRCC